MLPPATVARATRADATNGSRSAGYPLNLHSSTPRYRRRPHVAFASDIVKMATYASNGTSTPVRRVGAPVVKKEIWSSLLKSVSSGKRLATKQLVILGETGHTARELQSNSASRWDARITAGIHYRPRNRPDSSNLDPQSIKAAYRE